MDKQKIRKEQWIRARVTDAQLLRVAELEEATGLSISAVMRTLIESARLEPKPMPVAVVEVEHEGGVKVEEPSRRPRGSPFLSTVPLSQNRLLLAGGRGGTLSEGPR